MADNVSKLRGGYRCWMIHVLHFVIVPGFVFLLVFVNTFGGGSSGQRQLLFQVIWLAARRFPVRSETRRADVLFITTLAYVRPIVGMQPLVQLQVYELGELLRAQVTRVRFLAAM